MKKPNRTSVSVGGKELIFETGRIARQADGSVLLTCGETILLSTVCSQSLSDDIDFLPLRVDYIEKFSSAGKTLGGFIKREGRPTERETLIARLTDRPLRPMFENGFYDEIQLITKVLSYDGTHAPDPLAICSASAALVISSIPLVKPIGAVRVGRIAGEYVINPTVEQMAHSDLDLLLAGTEDAILMIEGFCSFLTEEQVLEAIEEGHVAIQQICRCLSDWQNTVGKEKNRSTLRLLDPSLVEAIDEQLKKEIHEVLKIGQKALREEALDALHERIRSHFCPDDGESTFSKTHVNMALKKRTSHYMRQMVLKEKMRCDGRHHEQIRDIFIETNILPRTHGSALFTRGETQSVAVCTLGSESMAQRYEDLNEESARRFYLQYSFPPYSVGEVGRMGPPGRREIGHGKLAERALSYTIPPQDQFPYTIRLESNITESNGSSSMASVCGGCLALMAAGVPIKRPVAGIAMGLILEEGHFAVLSDILGIEDALGDMDFKVTGDAHGITAFQMDIKVEGINAKIMQVALEQARAGRAHILEKMLEALPKSKETLSTYAPKISTLQIKPSKIGTVIGPGGKQIRAIVEETGVQVDINDDGIVSFSSTDQNALEKAKSIVYNLTAEVELGQTYTGRISSIRDFGLFVSILSQEGLCHISEISHERIDSLNGMFKEGDQVKVKVIEINERGQVRLSMKALLEGGSSSSSKGYRETRGGSSKEYRRPRESRYEQRTREEVGVGSGPKKIVLPPPPTDS